MRIEGFETRVVPCGYAISRPAPEVRGDRLIFYARIENGKARLECDGLSPLRDDSLTCTDWVNVEKIPDMIPKFATELLKEAQELKT